jgi:hypothetical protein
MASKLKVTDKQFLQALKLNDGKFAETAAYIQRRYGVKYTRQSVHERAHRKFPEELRDMRSIALNEAQTRLMAMVDDEGCDVRLRAKVAMHMVTALTKYRKYAL